MIRRFVLRSIDPVKIPPLPAFVWVEIRKCGCLVRLWAFVLSITLTLTVQARVLGIQDRTDCLSQNAVEALFSERNGEVARYLSFDTQKGFEQAKCVERSGAVLTARLDDGRQLRLRYVGTRVQGHWYEIVATDATDMPVVCGIETIPPAPLVESVRMKVELLDLEEVQVWRFAEPFRLVGFADLRGKLKWAYPAKPLIEWAVKAGREVLLYVPRPERIGDGFRGASMILPPPASVGATAAKSTALFQRFTPLVLDFMEDQGWAEEKGIRPPTVDISGQWTGRWKSFILPASGTLTAQVIQTQDRISGAMTLAGSPLISHGLVEGKVVGNSVNVKVLARKTVAVFFMGTAQGDEAAGRYCAINGDEGFWEALKR